MSLGKVRSCWDWEQIRNKESQVERSKCGSLNNMEQKKGRRAENEQKKKQKNVPCPIEGCGKFIRKHNLYAHRRTHSENRPYKCLWEGCSFSAHQEINLRVHHRKHTGEKPFECRIAKCDKTFSQQANRDHHELLHTKEKEYICPVEGCDYRAVQKGNWESHCRRAHPGQKGIAPCIQHRMRVVSTAEEGRIAQPPTPSRRKRSKVRRHRKNEISGRAENSDMSVPLVLPSLNCAPQELSASVGETEIASSYDITVTENVATFASAQQNISRQEVETFGFSNRELLRNEIGGIAFSVDEEDECKQRYLVEVEDLQTNTAEYVWVPEDMVGEEEKRKFIRQIFGM